MMKGFLARPFFRHQRIRYLAVGAWNTLAGCGIFAAFYYLLQNRLHYLVIAVLAHLLAVGNSWLGFRWLVFRSKAAWFSEYLRFNLSCLMVLAFQLAGLWLLVDYANIHPVISQLALVVLTVLLGYAIHSKFSFRQSVFQEQDESPL